MDYRIDEYITPAEQVYACANLYKKKLFTIAFEGVSANDILINISIRDYLYSNLANDLTKIFTGRVRYRKTKRLAELSLEEIKEIRSKFPYQLRQVSFGRIIPYVYYKNKRIRSDKYKTLVPDYEKAYSQLEKEGYFMDTSEFY